jgi:DNA-binding LytR/AlgR family response regulator
MTRCIAIEDEPLAVENLRRAINEIGHFVLEAVFDQADAGLQYAQQHDVDLIFLDVHLGNQNGLKQLKLAGPTAPVIVISANSQYAWQGFELDVCDYILKPYTTERLHKALMKFQSMGKQEIATNFLVKTESRFETVFYRDLICIEGMGDYRRLITHQNRVMTLTTFKELEETLDNNLIMRIHKSYMIALNALMSYENGRVILTNGLELPVSETYRKELKERLALKASKTVKKT